MLLGPLVYLVKAGFVWAATRNPLAAFAAAGGVLLGASAALDAVARRRGRRLAIADTTYAGLREHRRLAWNAPLFGARWSPEQPRGRGR